MKKCLSIALLISVICLITACSTQNKTGTVDYRSLSYKGFPVYSYLNASIEKVVRDFGEPIAQDWYQGARYYGYDGIAFFYDEHNKIRSISIDDLSVIEIDGITLNKNRAGLIATLGEPIEEGLDDGLEEEGLESSYDMIYANMKFSMPSPEDRAVLLVINSDDFGVKISVSDVKITHDNMVHNISDSKTVNIYRNPAEKGDRSTDNQGTTVNRSESRYRTVKIGNLTWMVENVNVKIDGSWCYDNNDANCAKYGRLYTWDAAMKVCPIGWRLPTREDWNALVIAAGSPDEAGKRLKSKSDWDGTDNFGFSALPGGSRYIDGSFVSVGVIGYWWSATESGNHAAYFRYMASVAGYVIEHNSDGLDHSYVKGIGNSVRCIQD